MNEDIMKKYLSFAPTEMREMIKGLKSEEHWTVYIYLLEHIEEEITVLKMSVDLYSDIEEIDIIIDDLSNSGLVFKNVKRLADIGDINKIRIRPTKLAIRLFDALFDTVIP